MGGMTREKLLADAQQRRIQELLRWHLGHGSSPTDYHCLLPITNKHAPGSLLKCPPVREGRREITLRHSSIRCADRAVMKSCNFREPNTGHPRIARVIEAASQERDSLKQAFAADFFHGEPVQI